MQLETNDTQPVGWWTTVVNLVLGLWNSFKKTPEEKQAKVDLMVEKAEAKLEVKDVKREAKIEKRIDKAKKAIDVSKLKKGRLIYVDTGNNVKNKQVFIGYTDTTVITEKGEYPYSKVFNWHGRPVINIINEIVTT